MENEAFFMFEIAKLQRIYIYIYIHCPESKHVGPIPGKQDV